MGSRCERRRPSLRRERSRPRRPRPREAKRRARRKTPPSRRHRPPSFSRVVVRRKSPRRGRGGRRRAVRSSGRSRLRREAKVARARDPRFHRRRRSIECRPGRPAFALPSLRECSPSRATRIHRFRARRCRAEYAARRSLEGPASAVFRRGSCSGRPTALAARQRWDRRALPLPPVLPPTRLERSRARARATSNTETPDRSPAFDCRPPKGCLFPAEVRTENRALSLAGNRQVFGLAGSSVFSTAFPTRRRFPFSRPVLMTTFVPAYPGGTVPDSHRVPFSPSTPGGRETDCENAHTPDGAPGASPTSSSLDAREEPWLRARPRMSRESFLHPQAIAAFPDEARRAIYDVISLRRDIRHFEPDREVDADALRRILSAAHQAPSVGLSQAWGFAVVRERASRERIRASFLECRRAEAARFSEPP